MRKINNLFQIFFLVCLQLNSDLKKKKKKNNYSTLSDEFGTRSKLHLEDMLIR